MDLLIYTDGSRVGGANLGSRANLGSLELFHNVEETAVYLRKFREPPLHLIQIHPSPGAPPPSIGTPGRKETPS